ncbi:hypothetical protein [[Pseudomonas] boreopolis]|uniref:hypothetical protein n=1 Tax=Xanthomonas boreopolis TaxID=86183 RepID=UPI003DA04667
MSAVGTPLCTIELLLVARRIADRARDEGALAGAKDTRPVCEHLGAVLADAVLQAGLNYTTVVRPRVLQILRSYPEHDTISSLMSVVRDGHTRTFLNWYHHQKVARFEALVSFLRARDVETVHDLRNCLANEKFCDEVQTLNGVGPKTVDYMACLVGIDSIAVDRHIRTFARAAGVENDDYHFLRQSFCCAADLLSLPRREFDYWLWRRAASSAPVQLALSV